MSSRHLTAHCPSKELSGPLPQSGLWGMGTGLHMLKQVSSNEEAFLIAGVSSTGVAMQVTVQLGTQGSERRCRITGVSKGCHS